ncbi:ribokinase [Brachybacterium paraconglomeratum]|uniref:ribokinase n=1 Tax=Brachybacterium paraconglomeratum TaxID=173362 RepID=UPI00223B49F7|nr:ribokinase [Brachybacterium paraconglomeratum]MCT1438478.1 ribokinase [Brachybacterium paraconglomeratum]
MSTVTVIGSVNIDDSIRMARLPGPGETVGARGVSTELGGKGANQAVAAARAGAPVRMVGAVGTDDSTLAVQALDADGIDTSALARLDHTPSGRALVMVDDRAENSIVVIPGANHAIPEPTIVQACAGLAPGDVMLLQHEIPAAASRLAASLSRRAGARVVWNAAPAPEHLDELVADVDLLIVNQHELAAVAELLCQEPAEDGVEDRIRNVSAHIGADVICTLGSDGAVALIDGELSRHPSPTVDAVDTTAAGDTFVGYLAAGMARGEDADRLLRTAALAGALAVTRRGASVSIPALDEVVQHLAPDERTAP